MKDSTLYEIAGLTTQDCMTSFPLAANRLEPVQHFHDEYELLLITQGDGLRLSIGGELIPIAVPALVLLSPGLVHSWDRSGCNGDETAGQVIRWPGDLLGRSFLGKSQLQGIDSLLLMARRGVLFSPETIEVVSARILQLGGRKGFETYLGLLSILHDLSASPGSVVLSSAAADEPLPSGDGGGIDSAYAFMKANFDRPISLEEVAKTASMTRGAFCRYIRKRTGKTYLESLNEIRIAHICQRLVDSTDNIAEIAYKAGYNNIAYFSRWFKRQKGCTPKEYRQHLSVKREQIFH